MNTETTRIAAPIDRLVRIRWRDGEPFVAIGDVYEVGKKKKHRRVSERGGETGQQLSGWSTTITHAFDVEIQWWANYFCTFMDRRRMKYDAQRELDFVDMELAMCQLHRLRRKLEKHKLI